MSALAGGKYGKQICGGYYHDGFICVGHFNDGMRLEWSEFVDVGVLMDQGDGVTGSWTCNPVFIMRST